MTKIVKEIEPAIRQEYNTRQDKEQITDDVGASPSSYQRHLRMEERYEEFVTIFLPSYLHSNEITIENQVGSGARATAVLLRLWQASLSLSGNQILS